MFNSGYNNFYPSRATITPGLFSSLKGKFNLSSVLSNTQKTLNIVNQAIPVFYQIKPIWSNTKTMFKILGAVKSDDTSIKSTKPIQKKYNTINSVKENVILNNYTDDNSPNFFL